MDNQITKKLSNPPILEAIIYLAFDNPNDTSVFEKIEEGFKEKFPFQKPLENFHASIQFEKKSGIQQVTSKKNLDGFSFYSEDNGSVAQFRKQAFSFSKLKPYKDWNSFLENARFCLSHYLKPFQGLKTKKAGVRFINRLELSSPTLDLKEIFTAPPVIPENLPQNLVLFLQRFTLQKIEKGLISNIILATEKSQNPKFLSILFDIDVFSDVKFDLQPAVPNTKLEECLNRLREFKNEIFFSWLTEKQIEVYQ